MKQTMFFLMAMFLVISAQTANAQNVILWINGQAMSYPANTPVTVPGVGTITASQAVQYYPQPQQQPQTLPASNTNSYNDQLSQANNQLALENKALQNEALKEQIRQSKSERARGWVSTVINGGTSVANTVFNGQTTNATVGLLRSQSRYLDGMTGCCGGSGTTVTPPVVPGGNPVYNPPGGTIWYDNQDGLGTFYVLNGQRVYTVAPPGAVITYQYAGQTPTNNGWSNPNFGNQGGYVNGQPNAGGTPNFGGNFNPYTNSTPGYEYGVRTY